MAFLTPTSLKVRAPTPPVARCPLRMSDDVLAPIAPLNADEKVPMKEPYEVKVGKKAPVCRCWQSGKFPLCDGSHNKFNKETGSKIGPLVISATE